MKNRITNPNITKLKKNEIFVFGSNKDGNHAGGAAKLAHEKFGAEMGKSSGLQGRSYAINTMSGIKEIEYVVGDFILFAKAAPDTIFLVTEIACGIAGFKPEEIAPLFINAVPVENIHLPESFWNVLNTLTPAKQPIRGYKVFNPDFTCRGMKFEVGKEYTLEGPVKICNSGFHFCLKASNCFAYYSFDSKNIVCEVEALGDTDSHTEDSKICTNHLRIVRQLTWQEVLQVSNDGKDNTGHSNTGSWNTGDRNTGSWNTGSWNTGDRNTGYSNTGSWNTGYSNTGSWNTGDRNTGYSNTGDRNTGAFCTGEKTMKFFNKDSDWTEKKFLDSKVYELLREVDTKLWVPEYSMTDKEKEENKGWKTAEGFYRDIPFKEAFQNKWHNWSANNRKAFTTLPNFDADIFFEITGVRL